MEVLLETKRCILREIVEDDAKDLFELDSDPLVHKHLGNNVLKSIDQVLPIIKKIRAQYVKNGIGRWAVIEKVTGKFMGWTGLKLEEVETNGVVNYYDLGFRLMPKYWGKGIGYETAKASLDYGFNELNYQKICGAAEKTNLGSCRILAKVGLKFINEFYWDNEPCNWYEISRLEYLNNEK